MFRCGTIFCRGLQDPGRSPQWLAYQEDAGGARRNVGIASESVDSSQGNFIAPATKLPGRIEQMQDDSPSVTAQGAAIMRALHQEVPQAERILDEVVGLRVRAVVDLNLE